MAVYYKFKSAKDYDSIPIDGHFISVLNLKEKIFESKHLGRGTDFDLVVTNAQTNEEYLDEATLVPKNTSVLIRRVPGRPRMPIITQPVIQQDEQHVEANKSDYGQPANSNNVGAGSSVTNYPDDSEWDEFGSDLYAIPEAFPVQISNPIQDAAPPSIVDEDSKIKALIETPALDWQRQSDGYGPGRGFGRGMGGRMMGGRGFGRGGFEKKTPPPGYVCHRCNQPGHFIQHCPTNGVPEFDVKRVKPPTGIPKSMLMATPDGSYALPSGAVAVLKPNEAAFEKEIEGLPSNRPVGDLPPEYLCPLCKEVMKDAVLTTKCCFTSFCDKCIRDHIINKSICVCGDNHVLADDLVPNKTLRDSINRTMETNNSSTENGGSAFQVQDMESKMEHPRIQQKVPSPTHSAASKGNQAPPLEIEESSKAKEAAGQNNALAALENTMEKDRIVNVPDVCEATNDSMSVREHAPHGSAPLADDEMQQKPVSGDTGKKKKKKKVRVPPNGSDMQWRDPHDFQMENPMMPMGPSAAYNPYWNGMPHGMEGFYPHFGAPIPPFMGYGPGPFDIPLGFMPQDPYGVPNMMMPPPPFPPQRDMPREREFRDTSSNGDVSLQRPKSKLLKPPSNDDHIRPRHHHPDRPSPPPEYRHHRSERPSPPPDRLERDPDLPRPSSKRKSSDPDHHHHRHREDSHRRRDHHHRSDSSARSPAPEAPLPAKPAATSAAAAAAAAAAEMDRNHKASVFSRISFPTEEQKKRKSSSSADVASGGGGYYNDHNKKAAVTVKRVAMEVDDESSEEEDRHFKRRPARYEPSPPSPEEREDSRRSRGGTKERERERRHR